MNHSVIVIGGGPAGLMAAEVLSQKGVKVDVFDAMPSLGRKFLLAGRGGLNLTHSEPFEKFIERYGNQKAEIEKWFQDFKPEDLRKWAASLGIDTFIGTSGRVFPVGMKSSPLLRAWLNRLIKSGVVFHTQHRWTGKITYGQGRLQTAFSSPEGEKLAEGNAIILALGGGSWAKLGSDGAWVKWLMNAGIKINPLKPSNCGFDTRWSPHFITKFDGAPLKSVILTFGAFCQQGEFIVTKDGVEGGLIYAASIPIRNEIEQKGSATIMLDMAPNRTEDWLIQQLSKPRGTRSFSSHITKTVGIKDVKLGLIYEFLGKNDFNHPEQIAALIKRIPIQLTAPRPLDEAISSAGGVSFDEMNEFLMLTKMPGVFCAGEMIDWEAPTGGYLLSACFGSGRMAATGVLKWLKE